MEEAASLEFGRRTWLTRPGLGHIKERPDSPERRRRRRRRIAPA
jgi:hypothetical protein